MLENPASLINAADLRFRYPGAIHDVLDIDDLRIARGEFVSLLGASGSGKSTLLRLIAGLLKTSSGSLFRGPGEVGMVFQSPNLIPWRTAQANVKLPVELGTDSTEVSAERLSDLFRLVGFRDEDIHKRPAELSGGMQMRVALARALVLQPSVLLLDEPFAALDDVLRMQLEEDVRRIHDQQNLTTVLVTHNIQEAVFMSDRVLILGDSPSCIVADVAVDAWERNTDFRRAAEFHSLVNRVTEELRAAAGAPA